LRFSGLILEKKMFFWVPHAEKRPKTRLKQIEGKRQEKSFFSTFSAKSF
jgi:hypothetical protein